MAEHDYSKRSWGHDYTFTPIDGGLAGDIAGWGHGLEVGDFLILRNGESTTRYRINEIRYERDPSDMWFAKVSFAPRT